VKAVMGAGREGSVAEGPHASGSAGVGPNTRT